ncbi:hypothetical protein B0H11DRAFT_2255638 [Mycena galericulata]|nr:hypothetical protein B0H11DRAFT_2255638 [Mycena galericulata]
MATAVCKFDAQLSEQLKTSNELLVYSVSIQALFRVAWPTVNGSKMTPRELVQYLQTQHLHFPCFCSKLFNTIPYAAEFTITIDASRDEQSYAYCHFNPPRCSYFLDLLRIYREAETVLEYPPGPLITQRPYMHGLWVNYFTSTWQETGPYVFHRPQLYLGFLGEANREDLPEDTRTRICRVKSFDLDLGQLGPKHMVPHHAVSQAIQTLAVPSHQSETAIVPAAERIPGERIAYVEPEEADPL